MNPTENKSLNSDAAGLSVSFFQYLIDQVEAEVGSEVIREFESVKSRRDRYLREEWAPSSEESGQLYFREIDYEYLVTLLGNRFADAPDQLYPIYLAITRVCVQFGELKKARDLLAVLESDFSFEKPKRRLSFLMLKGKWAIYARELEQALSCYTEALEQYTELGEKTGIVKALNNLGIITFEQWETDQGKQYFQQADELIGQNGENIPADSETFVKMNLGILEGMQGDFPAAIQQFENLESAFPDLEGMPKIKVLLNKGVALKDDGRLEEARTVLREAVELARDLPSYHAYGDAVLDLAEVNVRAGDYPSGQTYLAEGFKVFAKMHDRPSLAEAYRIFGILYREQGELDLAESQFEISIRIGKETGNLLYLTETYYEYSKWAEVVEEPERQRDYLQKSLSYARAMHGNKRIEKLENEINNLG